VRRNSARFPEDFMRFINRDVDEARQDDDTNCADDRNRGENEFPAMVVPPLKGQPHNTCY
jgi:hypothetical protein